MKKLIWCLLVLIIANKVQAQDHKFSVNTNLLNLALKDPSLSGEYKFSTNWSLQCYASAGKTIFWNAYSYKTVIIDFKYHLSAHFTLHHTSDTSIKKYTVQPPTPVILAI
ncbi:MAG: hypothetical protein JWQ25_1955 [Daejeonella sp.]|nr:hypothetical protein [Daejeonella sp.]